MDPITIASLVGTGLASGAVGLWAGRRSGDHEADDEPSIPMVPRSKFEQVERENEVLQKLAYLKDVEQFQKTELIGERNEFLKEQLAVVQAHNQVEAAAFLREDGVCVVGDDRSSEVGLLGAALGATSELTLGGRPPRSIEWRDARGNRLHLFEVELAGKNFYLAVWTLGVAVPDQIVGRLRYRCGGLDALDPAGGASSETTLGSVTADGEVGEALQPLFDGVEARGIGLYSGTSGELFARHVDAALNVVPLISEVSQAIGVVTRQEGKVGLDEESVVRLRAADGRQVGFHPFRVTGGGWHLLTLEVPANKTYPFDRMEKWIGRLGWRLPSVEETESHDGRQTSSENQSTTGRTTGQQATEGVS